MPAPKTDETKTDETNAKTEEAKTGANIENGEPEGESGETTEPRADPIAELRDLIGGMREELAGVREDMGSLRGIVDGMKRQVELGASIAAEGNPGESEEEDYPEIDLDEIARMTGDM